MVNDDRFELGFSPIWQGGLTKRSQICSLNKNQTNLYSKKSKRYLDKPSDVVFQEWENMAEKGNEQTDNLELLSLFKSGILTVQMNGYPVLKVDAKERSLDLEAKGIRECGIKLSNLIELESGKKGIRGMVSGSETTAKRLYEKDWSLTLYDRGSKILRMGRGVSRLTGHIQVNLLKFQRILESL